MFAALNKVRLHTLYSYLDMLRLLELKCTAGSLLACLSASYRNGKKQTNRVANQG